MKTYSDTIQFQTYKNIIDIDCENIQRKYRSELHGFVLSIIKRSSLYDNKHIILLRNFDAVLPKYQTSYKSVFEMGHLNSCFILSTTRFNQIHDNMKGFFVCLRIPMLKEVHLKKLLKSVCDDNDICEIDLKSVISACGCDLYTCLCEIEGLHASSEVKSTFTNPFERCISDLLETMKKTKSLEKVIESIRMTINKLLHYSLSDGWICRMIYAKSKKLTKLKLKSLDLLDLIQNSNTQLLNCSKKLFVYELLLIKIHEMIHSN
jgi:SepF-like predicted cell division protein (DUF552 family)